MGPSKMVVVGPSMRRLGVEELAGRGRQWVPELGEKEKRVVRRCLRCACYEFGERDEKGDEERKEEGKYCHGFY